MKKIYMQPVADVIEFDSEALMEYKGSAGKNGASETLSNEYEFEQSSIWDDMNEE